MCCSSGKYCAAVWHHKHRSQLMGALLPAPIASRLDARSLVGCVRLYILFARHEKQKKTRRQCHSLLRGWDVGSSFYLFQITIRTTKIGNPPALHRQGASQIQNTGTSYLYEYYSEFNTLYRHRLCPCPSQIAQNSKYVLNQKATLNNNMPHSLYPFA